MRSLLFPFCLVLFALGGCNFIGFGDGSAREIDTGEPFRLREGQSATFGDGGTFQFIAKRDDSRCPIDVVCIVAGQVSTHVEMSIGRRAAVPFTLTGHVAGDFDAEDGRDAYPAVDTLGYRFELLAVAPYPDTRVEEPRRTVATFRIIALD